MLASPAYLQQHGTPKNVAQLPAHTLLGFNEPDSLNHWPLVGEDGERLHVRPALAVSSGEILHRLALEGVGIVCLSDFLTEAARTRGELVQVLPKQTLDTRQPIHAVYYRNTAVSARISSFLDYLAEAMAQPFVGAA
ncbi:HTH-type transcriptional regulator DmlR [compost metagenome]